MAQPLQIHHLPKEALQLPNYWLRNYLTTKSCGKDPHASFMWTAGTTWAGIAASQVHNGF